MLSLILLVFAFVLAFIAAFFSAPIEPHRTRLIAAALAFFFAAQIFGSESIRKVFSSQTTMPKELQTAFLTGHSEDQ